jgi:ADP-heptose:LPS heptosyltransferase
VAEGGGMEISRDCKHFTGYRPCKNQTQCEGCSDYAPQGHRILIIKLGAMGDVLRTTPLLRGLKKKYPVSHITWITDAQSMPLLENNPFIDVLLPYGLEAFLIISATEYHDVICLDKDIRAVALGEHAAGWPKRHGFHLERDGKLSDCQGAEYLFSLGLSDELKFNENTKSYQECIFEACGLTWENEDYVFEFFPEEYMLRARDASMKAIALNTGCGKNWRQRQWGERNWVYLCRELLEKYPKSHIYLIGGPDETEMNCRISIYSDRIHSITKQSLRKVAALIEACDLIVTADTMAMHLALAVHTPPIVLLGPTHTPEIYLYGRGEKIVSDYDCVPCFRSDCDKSPGCVESIPVERVMKAIEEML